MNIKLLKRIKAEEKKNAKAVKTEKRRLWKKWTKLHAVEMRMHNRLNELRERVKGAVQARGQAMEEYDTYSKEHKI